MYFSSAIQHAKYFKISDYNSAFHEEELRKLPFKTLEVHNVLPDEVSSINIASTNALRPLAEGEKGGFRRFLRQGASPVLAQINTDENGVFVKPEWEEAPDLKVYRYVGINSSVNPAAKYPLLWDNAEVLPDPALWEELPYEREWVLPINSSFYVRTVNTAATKK